MTPVAQTLSAALVHFLWQGIAGGVLLAMALLLLRKSSANSRYVASCIVLATLALAPVVTGWVAYQSPPSLSAGPVAVGVSTLRSVVFSEATAEPAASTTSGKLEAWILPVWAAGVLAFALRLAWAGGHASSLRRHGVPADSAIQSMIQNLAERAGIRRTIRVLMSSLAEVPSVVGWLRPVILLPAAVVVGLTPQQLEALVAHELAHIRRHDYFVNILQMIVETFLFYHPVVWWVSSRIRYERELCCDDLAVRSCGSVVSYARALAQLERLRTTRPTLAMGSAAGPLFHRIQRLLGRSSAEYVPSKLVCAMGLLVGVLSLAFFMSDARAQQEKSVPAVLQELETVVQEVRQVPPSPPRPPQPPVAPVQPLTVPPAPPPAPAAFAVPPIPPAPLVLSAPPVAPVSVAPLVLAPVTPPPPLPAAPAVPWAVAPQAPAAPVPVAPQTPTRVPWVLFRGNDMHVRDTTADEVQAARKARESFTGNLLWFQLDGKAYVTQDPETIDRVLASTSSSDSEANLSLAAQRLRLAASQDRLNQKRALKDAQLNLQILNDRLSRIARGPENTQSLEEARRQLDSLRAENLKLQAMLERLEAQLRIVEKDTQWEADSARDLEVLRGAVRNGRAQTVP